MPRLIRFLRLLRLPLIAYLTVVLLMTFLETWLVYPVPANSTANWNPSNLAYEAVWFEAGDGTQLNGWLFEHPEPEHVVLYFHGNGELVPHNADLMDQMRRELEATVFIFDYRGYGKSQGKPHEAGLVADGEAAHQWLAERTGRSTDDIVLFGRSIGGAVAVATAAEHGAKALVLHNTFASMVDIAAELYRWLPVRLVMRNRYDSVERIAKYDGPVLQSHGTADRIVPYDHARRLFDAIASEHKVWIKQEDGTHNSPYPPDYFARVREFLSGLP